MKVPPNKNISLKKGKVSVFGVLLAFHCCYYGDIHWERRVRIGWREPGRTEWHHTLRRSSSLSSSSRFLFAAVLLPWLRPEERGLLLFLFLSDSSRRPTRSSSLSSWNERLLWAFESNGCNHCYHERLRGYQRKDKELTCKKALRWAVECLASPDDFITRTPGTLSTSSSLSSSWSSSENDRRPSVFTGLVVMWPLLWLFLPRCKDDEDVGGASISSISHSISSSPPSSSVLTWVFKRHKQ